MKEARKLVFGMENWTAEGEEVHPARGREWDLIRAAFGGARIHWLEGFLLFASWRTGRQEKDPYPKQFGVVASKTRQLLQEDLKIEVGRIDRTAKKTPTWKLSFAPKAVVSSNILDSVGLYRRAVEAFSKDDFTGWRLLRRAHEEWPEAASLARAMVCSSKSVASSDVNGEWLETVSECLDARKLALLGAVIKVTLLSRVRKLGVDPGVAKPFLRRWYSDLVMIRDALDVLGGQWTPPKGHTDPIGEFASLATRYINANAELGDGYDKNDPRDQAAFNERDAYLEQLCTCDMVTEAKSRVKDNSPALDNYDIDEDTIRKQTRPTIHDFLTGMPVPVRPKPVLFGQFCCHLRRVVESTWSTKPLALACGSDSALLSEIEDTLMSTLGVFEKNRLDRMVRKIAGTVPELLEDQWRRVRTDGDDADPPGTRKPPSVRGEFWRTSEEEHTESVDGDTEAPLQQLTGSAPGRSESDATNRVRDALRPTDGTTISRDSKCGALTPPSSMPDRPFPTCDGDVPPETSPHPGGVSSGPIGTGRTEAPSIDQIEVLPAPPVANLVRVIEGLESRSLRQLRTFIDGLRERSAAGIDLETDRKPHGEDK